MRQQKKVIEGAALSPEQVCKACTGMTIDELVIAIIENRGGQYDALYQKEGNK